jgi:glycosyltransferase involved in cell wall biosynthesis
VRILYLADAPYPHTWRWVKHFAALGHDCEVISFRPAEIEGARVTYVDGWERLGKLRYLIHARRVSRLINQRSPDLLHALHLTSYGFLGALSGYHPYLLSVWGTDILEAPGWTPFHQWLTRYSLRHADEITATGANLAAATSKYAPDGRPVHVVPYGVDMRQFEPKPRPNGERVVIGTVARLSVEKGLRYLIEAFARLREQFGDRIALRIAGDGPEQDNLERLARSLRLDVDFAGWVEHEELPSFLQSLDIFALPSLFEGFGVAAVEASAMELPVAGSNVYGIPDVVLDGATGCLVPPGDPASLAAAISRLIEDPTRRRQLGEAGRAFVAERYDWSKNTAQMEALYREFTTRAARAPSR